MHSITLCHDLLHNFNNNKITCCIFLDYTKAFDSVNHLLLLNKLKQYGFQDLFWFESYLLNRKQYIKSLNTVSSVQTIHSGVPQESVLGLTLFNLFITDITSLPITSQMLLYADDLVIYASDSSFDELHQKLQADLSLIHRWSVFDKLTISINKTKSILLGKKNTIFKLSKSLKSFHIGNSPLE